MVLCSGDINKTTCRSCLDGASEDILQLCPNSKAAFVWYDPCFLRYSNQNFVSSTVNSNPPPVMPDDHSVNGPGKFNKLVLELMDMIAKYASYNSSRKYATGEANSTVSNTKIYGQAQCTLDLSGDQCYGCLLDSFRIIPGNQDKQGLRVLGVRCNFRYDVNSFYSGSSMVQLPPVSPLQSDGTNSTTSIPTVTVEREGNKHNYVIVLAVAIPLVVSFMLICTICICYWKKRRCDRPRPRSIRSIDSIQFDLLTLRNAIANFSNENKLGEGGFGAVYKGTLLDGREIAVKRLSSGSAQGIRELKSELLLVAKLQHRNLVQLLGVCLEKQEKMLIYEYLPNRSLDTILFDSSNHEQLDWGRRYKIINGIARGLLYLHEDSQLKVIHRDIKVSNILLDEDMNPKIADFGLARLIGCDQTRETTKQVAGTFGYIAPEYAMRGQYSSKSDIFSFGVLVLEILTGKKNSNFLKTEEANNLLSYTWQRNNLRDTRPISGGSLVKK
ncbi:cysteine-rich receptor-like protein kinase 10 [Dioscorea cayenensis subsp. rotundata]|uniref:Cysteine-rich receptor-like protein kinase 10 n=1 Tax=Dioscorea cayennensis subsp. rotundata TaxID=55577 RepID=A0AB40CP27_DIOCR|nr:cysteine-rich receptor-like protein kinase 10 [Dioscorea cayenensis subsp. rotundata]